METVIRNVGDFESADRRAIEHVLGTHLSENQQVLIQVLDAEKKPALPPGPPVESTLPDWCNVYEGLSDSEIEEIETSIIRSRTNRAFK